MLKSYVGYILYFTFAVCQDYFDFQLYHNLTAERLQEIGEVGQRKSIGINRFAIQGLGRVLTWNIKKFAACTGEDDVPQLKEAVCAVLRSADVIALQEADNLRISCLPCYNEFKRDYEWSKDESSDEFKVLVKTTQEKVISLKKVGKCSTTDKEKGQKRDLGSLRQNMYPQVMRAFKAKEEELRLKRSGMYSKTNISDLNSQQNVSNCKQNGNLSDSTSETINTRFTLLANQTNSTKLSKYVSLNNSDTQQKHDLSRFHPIKTSDEKTVEKKVALTRFLLQSEQNNLTAGKENFTNAQNFTDKQVERFLTVNNDVVEINELNEKEELKRRLYKSRERLNNAPINENKEERFKVIDNKLTNIEKEIDEIIGTNNTNSSSLTDAGELGTIKRITKGVDHTVSNNLPFKKDTTKNVLVPNESNHNGGVVNKDANSFTKSHISDSGANSFTKGRISDSGANWYQLDLTVSLGNKKSTVQRHDRRYIMDDDTNLKTSPEKAVVSLPNHKKVVLYKSIIDSTGHAILKRAVKWDRERRMLLSKLKSHITQLYKRDNEPVADYKAALEIHYTITSITSDLNSGKPFLLVNLKLPKENVYQRKCFDDILVDLLNVIRDEGKTMNTLIMGDFHFDQLTDHDSTGSMSTALTNLHFNGENFHPVISYEDKDPITTIYGRRYDNIVTNINIQRTPKVIGPDFPIAPKAVILPFTLQRLYNNYITAIYTSGSTVADSIYQCIKAYQIAGKGELNKAVCQDTWVPSSYISDHLPLEITANFKVEGRATPIELKLGSWNIQGSSFKERLRDTSVKNMFLKSLNNYHVLIFHEFPSDEKVFDGDDRLEASNIARLTQGDLTTEFGIFIQQDAKDGETDMYALRKKLHSADEGEEEKDKIEIVSTVGLFIPKLVVKTRRIRPCLYTVKTSEKETPSFERLSILLDAIYKDVKTRECDFKMLMASLNFDESFDLASEINKKYKFKIMICGVSNGDNKDANSMLRTRDPADYVIFFGGEGDVSYSNCTVGLPGDEKRRGVEKLSDFQELSTHYPLSINIKKADF